jgi:hypothetical protein
MLEGFIYAVLLDNCIKVGFTTNMAARLRYYETGNIRTEILYRSPKQFPISREKRFHKLLNKRSIHGSRLREKYPIEAKETVLRVLEAEFGINVNKGACAQLDSKSIQKNADNSN